MSIRIEFGPGNSLETSQLFEDVQEVLDNRGFQSVLGYDPRAVEVLKNGVAACGSAPVIDGDILTLHTKAHTKG